MSTQFDWRSEDEREWVDAADEAAAPTRRPWPRRKVTIAGLALVLLIATVAWWVGQRLETADTSLEAELRDSERLLQQAGDTEVLSTMLSGRSEPWAAAQMALRASGLLTSRPQLGLHLAESEPVSLDISLAPNLISAEVTADYRYLGAGDGHDAIILRQMRIYRRSGDRWLLSPPTADYWGGVGAVGGRYITVQYPMRDAELAERLAADLEGAIAGSCAQLAGLDCPEAVHSTLTLSTDPDVLLRSAEPTYRLEQREELLLPTPT
ncbi:MAG: hypothetical protein R3300_06200, partial [Candidatus Promineifilaceae bacterium]|nr:hypothetical protein [Candidatus Promineifilaceae bacterium]